MGLISGVILEIFYGRVISEMGWSVKYGAAVEWLVLGRTKLKIRNYETNSHYGPCFRA